MGDRFRWNSRGYLNCYPDSLCWLRCSSAPELSGLPWYQLYRLGRNLTKRVQIFVTAEII